MAQLTTTSSRIKIWAYTALPTGAPMHIDPNGPTNPDTGQLLGYLTKRIFIKAWVGNNGNVQVWDRSQSPGMYYELDSGQEVVLNIDSSLLVLLSGSAGTQGVSVLMELQTGAT